MTRLEDSLPSRLEIEADSDGVRLAGTLWRPAGEAVAGVLMHPGSGPSDRDNDVLFPPIREHLLGAGIAVCSFDKRGVGGSGGSWLDAGIETQADDLLAGLAVFESESAALPIGLFGHSQGGWVVVEAAGRGAPVAFVIPNSGPVVSPARQERYSLANRVADDRLPGALEVYDAVVAVLRERPSLETGLQQLDAAGVPYRELPGLDFALQDEAVWGLSAAIFDYDPAPALSRITAPVLALFGAADKVDARRRRASSPSARRCGRSSSRSRSSQTAITACTTASRRASSRATSTGSARSRSRAQRHRIAA